MAFLKSLPRNASIGDVYRGWREQYRPWMKMGQALMRGESELSEAERELIATYVSMLNGCEYCVISHRFTVEKLGIEPHVIDRLTDDLDDAPISEKIRSLLKFCKKLTLNPAGMTQDDANAVYAAGWGEEALHTAVGVTCRFSYMNRLTLGLGLAPLDQESAHALSEDRVGQGYDKMDDEGEIYRRKP